MIYRATVLELDAGTHIELEVKRLLDGAVPPAGAALFEVEGDRLWTDPEIEAWCTRVLTEHRRKMPSPRHGLHVDLRPFAEKIWRLAWVDHQGFLEAWREQLHLMHNRLSIETLCGRTAGRGWYLPDKERRQEALHPRAIAEQLPHWADAGERRCKRCELTWEAEMLADRIATP